MLLKKKGERNIISLSEVNRVHTRKREVINNSTRKWSSKGSAEAHSTPSKHGLRFL